MKAKNAHIFQQFINIQTLNFHQHLKSCTNNFLSPSRQASRFKVLSQVEIVGLSHRATTVNHQSSQLHTVQNYIIFCKQTPSNQNKNAVSLVDLFFNCLLIMVLPLPDKEEAFGTSRYVWKDCTVECFPSISFIPKHLVFNASL